MPRNSVLRAGVARGWLLLSQQHCVPAALLLPQQFPTELTYGPVFVEGQPQIAPGCATRTMVVCVDWSTMDVTLMRDELTSSELHFFAFGGVVE